MLKTMAANQTPDQGPANLEINGLTTPLKTISSTRGIRVNVARAYMTSDEPDGA
jgi:hypothetical protein